MLHEKDLAHTASIIWQLQQRVSSDLKRRNVIMSLSELLNAEYIASYIINIESKRPSRGFTLNIDQELIADYEAYQYSEDIVTPIASMYLEPVIIDEVLDRKKLENSSHYNDFLKPNGMHHGINMFISKNGSHIGDFRIWRSREKAPFSQREVNILRLLKPYFEASLSKNEPLSNLLTAKEIEVVNFLPLGFSDKEIAREMTISVTTIRSHINSAMRKLGCKNRTQLAVLLSRDIFSIT